MAQDITGRRKPGDKMKSIAFITRVHPSRPKMLRVCIESIKSQSSNDWVQYFQRDPTKGYGIEGANKALALVKNIDARYVMVLDDDDMLVYEDFVKEFSNLVHGIDADIVFFKGKVEGMFVFPLPDVWRRRPIRTRIASFNFAVRREIWEKYINVWGKPHSGDGYFIIKCYENTKRHLWWDKLIAKTQSTPGHGRGEDERD